jgi:protoporphyrin/coproporphyrin ferrochelatase
MSKTAVVVMNLGGPDSAEAVEPFLFNLFFDPAIIGLPKPLRWLIARMIAHRRGPIARAIYAKIGNASPLLGNTKAQAAALEALLGPGFRVVIAMRYWRPRAREAVDAVKRWGAEKIILLPLYPQFSSTTTASSVADWRQAATAAGLTAPTRAICCYPAMAGFVEAAAGQIERALGEWPAALGAPRLLLSAHGLPERVVERGDPYRAQVEETAAALRRRLGRDDIETVVCYQSRVGPLKWIGPATDAEIRRAGAAGKGLIIAPIAFVSEHSETLVELDIEYRHLADQSGVPRYVRVPTVDAAESFIAGLAQLVRAADEEPGGFWHEARERAVCDPVLRLCPRRSV